LEVRYMTIDIWARPGGHTVTEGKGLGEEDIKALALLAIEEGYCVTIEPDDEESPLFSDIFPEYDSGRLLRLKAVVNIEKAVARCR
jgi:hypothetical protein